MDRLKFYRISLFILCLAPVIFQAYQEFKNYSEGLTSSAISTEVIPGVNYPDVVVCKKSPFRASANWTMVADHQSWDEATYALGEIFVPESINSSQMTVETLYTRFDGRCYRVIVHDNVTYNEFISFDLRHPEEVYLVFVTQGK